MFKTHPKASKILVSVKACYIFKPIALIMSVTRSVGRDLFYVYLGTEIQGRDPCKCVGTVVMLGRSVNPLSWNTRNSPCLAYFKNDIAEDFMYGTSQLQLASARN